MDTASSIGRSKLHKPTKRFGFIPKLKSVKHQPKAGSPSSESSSDTPPPKPKTVVSLVTKQQGLKAEVPTKSVLTTSHPLAPTTNLSSQIYQKRSMKVDTKKEHNISSLGDSGTVATTSSGGGSSMAPTSAVYRVKAGESRGLRPRSAHEPIIHAENGENETIVGNGHAGSSTGHANGYHNSSTERVAFSGTVPSNNNIENGKTPKSRFQRPKSFKGLFSSSKKASFGSSRSGSGSGSVLNGEKVAMSYSIDKCVSPGSTGPQTMELYPLQTKTRGGSTGSSTSSTGELNHPKPASRHGSGGTGSQLRKLASGFGFSSGKLSTHVTPTGSGSNMKKSRSMGMPPSATSLTASTGVTTAGSVSGSSSLQTNESTPAENVQRRNESGVTPLSSKLAAPRRCSGGFGFSAKLSLPKSKTENITRPASGGSDRGGAMVPVGIPVVGDKSASSEDFSGNLHRSWKDGDDPVQRSLCDVRVSSVGPDSLSNGADLKRSYKTDNLSPTAIRSSISQELAKKAEDRASNSASSDVEDASESVFITSSLSPRREGGSSSSSSSPRQPTILAAPRYCGDDSQGEEMVVIPKRLFIGLESQVTALRDGLTLLEKHLHEQEKENLLLQKRLRERGVEMLALSKTISESSRRPSRPSESDGCLTESDDHTAMISVPE